MKMGKPPRRRCGCPVIRFIHKLDVALRESLEQENLLAEETAASDDYKTVFDRLSELVHLDNGDVKYGDGKLRFLG